MKKDVNHKIKIAMTEACMTQKDVAKKLGVKQALISKWVTGKSNPKLSTLERIANATGKPLNFFLNNSINSGDEVNQVIGDGRISSKKDATTELLEKEVENLKLKKDSELSKKDNELLKKDIEILKLQVELLKRNNKK